MGPEVHMPRIIDLDGGHNVRDMGGLPLADGRRTRFGVVYRASALGALSEKGKRQFASLNIKCVVDVRESHEHFVMPTDWMRDYKIRRYHEPRAVPKPDLPQDALQKILAAKTPDEMRQHKEDNYRLKPLELSKAIHRLFVCIADEAPVLFHCAGGNDRTGVMGAILILALGGSRETAAADYEFSNIQNEDRQRTPATDAVLKSYGLDRIAPELLDALATLRSRYLFAALDAIDDKFGSFETYLRHICGIGRDLHNRVCQKMVVPGVKPL